jgi:hypothetical protein
MFQLAACDQSPSALRLQPGLAATSCRLKKFQISVLALMS